VPAPPLDPAGVVAVDVDGVELEVVGVDAVGVLDAGVVAGFALEPAALELLPVLCVLVPDPDLCCLALPPDELLNPPLESRTAINTPIASQIPGI